MRLSLIILSILCLANLPAQEEAASSSIYQIDREKERSILLTELDSVCAIYRNSLDPGGQVYFEYRDSLLAGEEFFEEAMHRAKQASFYFGLTGQLDKARRSIDRFYRKLEKIKDLESKGSISFTKSFVEEQGQNNELALSSIEQGIIAFEALQDTSLIEFGESYRAKARILQSMGRFGESSLAYARAKDIFIVAKDSIGIADALVGLGILYAQIGLYDESEDYFKSRYKYISGPKEVVKFRDALNLGRNKIVQGDYEGAVELYEEARRLKEELNPPPHFSLYTYNGLIESLYFAGRKDEVVEHYQDLQRVIDAYGEFEGLDFLIDQSAFFYQLVREEYDKAEPLALELYEQSIQKQDASETMLHLQFLAELYKQKGDYQKALDYSSQYNSAKDSALTANKTNALLLFQTQYETEEKEREIVTLGKEKEREEDRNRNLMMLVGGLAGILLLISYLFIQLRRTRKQLEEQNHELTKLNATKNKFFGIIGHDLRNPLLTMDAVGNRIRRQMIKEDYGQVTESVDMLSDNLRQVNGLLDNLLKWALSENGVMPYHPEDIELQSLVQQNVDLYKDLALQKEIDLLMKPMSDMRVNADRDAMQGICRNLISNAIKFTPRGGHIEIAAEQQGEEVVLTFSDTGVGMDRAQVEALFDDGFRSERGTDGETGTGLGLTLVKELIEMNGGVLEVESTPGQGSVFKVRLRTG